MKKTSALRHLAASIYFLGTFAPAEAQQSVRIPLQGTLEPRCTARVHDLQVTPGADLKIVLYVDHSCNSSHTLLLKVFKGSGADLSRAKVTYAGKDPTQKTEDDAAFRYGKPVTMTGTLTIEVPNASEQEKQAILDSLNVQVLPD